MSDYSNDSIRALKGAERLRTRPESMLGSNGLDGAKHTVIELVGNATDEKLAGYGSKLEISLYEDHSISVRDYGRGVPLGWNDAENAWNYFLIYEELYAGGKYDKNQGILRKIEMDNSWDSFKIEDYPYLITIGLNGLGAAASQYTSEFFEVISYRDGKASRMLYEKGVHILDELEIYDTTEPNGTYIRWKPDNEVFSDVNIPAKWLEKLCKNLSHVAEFEVVFNNKGVETVFPASSIVGSMSGSVENYIHCKNFTHTVDSVNEICICDAEVVIGEGGRGSEFFHNRVEVRGGVHAGAFASALSNFFYNVSAQRGIKIKEVDYSGKFSIIVSTLSNKMSLRGQTKDYLDDSYVYDCIFDCIYKNLTLEYQKGTSWLLNIVEQVVANASNRIAIAEMSKNLKEIEKSTKRHKPSEKFKSCETYDKGKAEETEYFIVEGDSAGGRVKTARDSNYQCILPIRGKSLNVYKATIAKLIANREIRDMVATLGCGIDLGLDEYDSFDISKLKVGKIIFLADADIDGKHIIMLLFLIFYKLFPELLYQGKVYVAETPLYVINTLSGDSVYCMSYEEMLERTEEIGKHNIRSTDRFKGLGETDAEVLWNTTLNPETRHLRQLKIDRNDMELCDTLEVLFGTSTDRRKRAILGSMMEGFDETIESINDLIEQVNNLDLDSELEYIDVEV